MQPSAILETALYVNDLDAADAFYRDVMGLERLASVADRHVFFRCGAGVLLLFNPQATQQPAPAGARLPVPPHGTLGQGHLAFSATADEITQWKTHLQQKNIAIEADFEWPNGGRSIYFRDPAGNSLEITEPRIWGF